MIVKIGERIKHLRKTQNVTQETLAAALNISYQAVSKWENGTSLPDITLLPHIADFFGVTTDYLLDFSSQKQAEEIEELLAAAQKADRTGAPEVAISLLRQALCRYPNEHRILADLIEYQVTAWQSDDPAWLADIETKAKVILNDCRIDALRYRTITNLALAYSFAGEKAKAEQTATLLPAHTYSGKELLSMIGPPKERVGHLPECILANAEAMLANMLSISKYHNYYGDPAVAIDVCNRTLAVITALGDEGFLLFMKESAYYDLMIAYAKREEVEKMFAALEQALEINHRIDAVLKSGGTEYTSPFFAGLRFDRDAIKRSSEQSAVEAFLSLLEQSNTLKPYRDLPRYRGIVSSATADAANANTAT